METASYYIAAMGSHGIISSMIIQYARDPLAFGNGLFKGYQCWIKLLKDAVQCFAAFGTRRPSSQ